MPKLQLRRLLRSAEQNCMFLAIEKAVEKRSIFFKVLGQEFGNRLQQGGKNSLEPFHILQ